MTEHDGYDLLLPSRGSTVAQALAAAERAEALGWRGFWSSEVLGPDAIALAAAVLARTRRLRVGTGIVPISTRSAALLAMGAATLEGLAPGRFSLGLGASTPAIVADRHDRPVASPLAETRGTLEVVRRALAGERVDHEATPRVRDLRIAAPDRPPPVLLAALGPRMTRLAVEEADGLVLNWLDVAEAGRRAADARTTAGEGFQVTMLVRTAVEPTDGQLARLTKEIAAYCRVPAYARQLSACSFDVRASADAEDLDAAAAALPDGLVEAVAVTGSADECRRRLDALVAAGVTPLVLPVGGGEAVESVLTALAP